MFVRVYLRYISISIYVYGKQLVDVCKYAKIRPKDSPHIRMTMATRLKMTSHTEVPTVMVLQTMPPPQGPDGQGGVGWDVPGFLYQDNQYFAICIL